MCTKIDLFFSRVPDLDLLEKGVTFWTIRTKVQIRLQREGGWTRPFDAIVDTGAPISVLPQRVWEQIERGVLGKDTMRGIVPGEGSVLPVEIAEVGGLLVDEKGQTGSISFRSYLVSRDDVPLILGVDSLLSRCVLHIDYPQSQGYLELCEL